MLEKFRETSLDHYQSIADKSLSEIGLSDDECIDILISPDIELISLINAAFTVRKKTWGKDVLLHVIDNVQNGLCSEDCRYCAQSKLSGAPIEEYPMKTDGEILLEAKAAYEAGAHRHCMVFSGKGSSEKRIEEVSRLVRQIKSLYPMQICVSPGIVSNESLKKLKDAGVDRINHNINTSENYYKNICSTHSYKDRIDTITSASKIGLQICSGVIVGMGETPRDVIDAARTLGKFKIDSMPVNFFIPMEGTPLENINNLTPEYCLRVLCLFRFLNPKAEIRIAAGREYHLRDMEVLALYPANSLFIDGYLNTKGSSRAKTLKMIRDAGFEIKSDHGIDELLSCISGLDKNTSDALMKDFKDLHPSLKI